MTLSTPVILLTVQPWYIAFATVLGLHAIFFGGLFLRKQNPRFILLALAFTCWSVYWYLRSFRMVLPHMPWIRLGGYAFAIPAIIWLIVGWRRRRDASAH